MARPKGAQPKWAAYDQRKQHEQQAKVGITLPLWAGDGFNDLAAARKARGLASDSRQAAVQSLVAAAARVAAMPSFRMAVERMGFERTVVSAVSGFAVERERVMAIRDASTEAFIPSHKARPLSDAEKGSRETVKVTPYLRTEELDALLPWLRDGLTDHNFLPENFARSSVAGWLAENAARALRREPVFERLAAAPDLEGAALSMFVSGAVLWYRLSATKALRAHADVRAAWAGEGLTFADDVAVLSGFVVGEDDGEGPDPSPEEIARMEAAMKEMVTSMAATASANLDAIMAKQDSAPEVG